jgi:hypothetical protein
LRDDFQEGFWGGSGGRGKKKQKNFSKKISKKRTIAIQMLSINNICKFNIG